MAGNGQTRGPGQERRVATERAILDAAESLIEQRRYSEISVEDVMAATKLGRTAFYRYFPDLESVVERLMTGLIDEIWGASADWMFSEDPVAPLADAVRRLVTVYRDHGRVLQAFEDAARAGSELRDRWNEKLGAMVGPLKSHMLRLIMAGRANAELPEETIDALAIFTERYLLSVYGQAADVPAERPTAVLMQVWARTLQLR